MWSIKPNQKKQMLVVPNVLNYQMPATLIKGKYPEKTVVITAGLHSGEYPGIPATIHVAKTIDPHQVHGTILFIHCVNTSSF